MNHKLKEFCIECEYDPMDIVLYKGQIVFAFDARNRWYLENRK